MSRRLFVIQDSTLTRLGSGIGTKMVEELKRLFSFAASFAVQVAAPSNLPKTIDFTDSIVKLVADDASVNEMRTQATQQQIRAIQFAIDKNAKLRVKLPAFQRETGEQDRGGIGWASKRVFKTSTGIKIALVQTGGIVSVQTAAETVLTFLAPNKRSLQEATDEYKQRIKLAELEHENSREHKNFREQKIKSAEDSLAKSRAHWARQGTPPNSWPQEFQDKMGVTLGRLVAHEARHQYVGPHSQEGLGMEAALMLGGPGSESFSKDDQKVILAELKKLEDLQKTAKIHIETFPAGQDFAFKEF